MIHPGKLSILVRFSILSHVEFDEFHTVNYVIDIFHRMMVWVLSERFFEICTSTTDHLINVFFKNPNWSYFLTDRNHICEMICHKNNSFGRIWGNLEKIPILSEIWTEFINSIFGHFLILWVGKYFEFRLWYLNN